VEIKTTPSGAHTSRISIPNNISRFQMPSQTPIFKTKGDIMFAITNPPKKSSHSVEYPLNEMGSCMKKKIKITLNATGRQMEKRAME
jgi:hypothetical protein